MIKTRNNHLIIKLRSKNRNQCSNVSFSTLLIRAGKQGRGCKHLSRNDSCDPRPFRRLWLFLAFR